MWELPFDGAPPAPSKSTALTVITPKKNGRPSLYSVALTDTICDRLINGEILTDICNSENGMPDVSTFFRWCRAMPDVRAKYRDALDWRADTWADERVSIARNHSHDLEVIRNAKTGDAQMVVPNPGRLARDKFHASELKDLMGKHARKRYGDGPEAPETTEHPGDNARIINPGPIIIEHDPIAESAADADAALEKALAK